MISYEELTGYFDLAQDGYRQEYSDKRLSRRAYPCLVCCALVLTVDSERHVEWHKEIYRSNKEKTPLELQQEAKRELGRLKDAIQT